MWVLGSGAKHCVGRVARIEGNAWPPPLPHSYYQPRLFSEGDRVSGYQGDGSSAWNPDASGEGEWLPRQ